jgi:hypothetical protein
MEKKAWRHLRRLRSASVRCCAATVPSLCRRPQQFTHAGANPACSSFRVAVENELLRLCRLWFGVAVRFGMGSLARNCCQRWSFHLRPHDLGCNVRAVRLLLTALSPMRQPTSADLHRITGCICRSRHTNAPHRERSVSPAGSHAVGRPCYTPGSPCRSHPRQSESEL